MTIWLSIFLFMSLCLNLILGKACIEYAQKIENVEEMRKELEKLHKLIGKTVGKYTKGEK